MNTIEVETATLGKHKVLIDRKNYDPKIVDGILRGTYEGGERHVVPKILKTGDRVIEVGGAIGTVSMAIADVVGPQNVVCFEANPKLIEDAKRNFALNGLSIRFENAVLQNRICWAGEGSDVDFFIHKEYWASSLAKTPGTIGSVKVGTKCFETEARNFTANALVCDIEGGEIELLGSADLSGFNKILMEIHYWAGREAINKMIRKLILDGFSIDFDNSFGSIVTMHRGLAPS
jgi:FkbM family methyltransferase